MLIEADPLSLLFIGCFLFGLLFLVITSFLGTGDHSHSLSHATHAHVPHVVGSSQIHHAAPASGGHLHHTAGHHSHAPHAHQTGHNTQLEPSQANNFLFLAYINPISISLFLLGFGFFGYLFHNTTNLALPLALSFAGIGGFIIAGLILMMLNRLFAHSEAATVQDVADRTGLLGKVSIAIAENGLGEITYTSPGGLRKSVPARSTDGRRLERGQEIVVVNYERGIAEVDTWDHFVHQEEKEEVHFISQSSEDDLSSLRALLEESDSTNSEYITHKDTNKE